MKSSGMWSRILLTIGCFLAAAAMACAMFLYADTLRQRAADTDRAVLAAQSAVEKFKAGYELERFIYFDQGFVETDNESVEGYILEVEVSNDRDGLYRVTASVRRQTPYRFTDKTELCTLTTLVYRRGG